MGVHPQIEGWRHKLAAATVLVELGSATGGAQWRRNTVAPIQIAAGEFAWAVESLCSLLRRPFQRELLLQQFVPPYDAATLVQALDALGITAEPVKRLKPAKLQAQWCSPAACS